MNKALETYNNALKVADTLHNEEDIYFIKEQLAVIAFFSKKYEEAEKLFLEVKGYLMRKGLKVDDLKISYITLRLAEIYDNLRNSKLVRLFLSLPLSREQTVRKIYFLLNFQKSGRMLQNLRR